MVSLFSTGASCTICTGGFALGCQLSNNSLKGGDANKEPLDGNGSQIMQNTMHTCMRQSRD